MNRKHLICCILLIFWLLTGALSGIALATGSSYPLWVGAVQVTDANKDDLTQAINAIMPNVASGTATYDPTTNTLLLNDFTYTGEGVFFAEKVSGVSSTAVIYSELETLRITVVNTNLLSHTGTTAQYSYGIYTTGNLNITAESTGELTVDDSSSSGVWPERSIGVNLYKGELSVSGGSLSAVADEAEYLSTGVWCFNGNVTVNEKGTLIGIGGDSAISRGLCVSDMLVIRGGVVKGVAGKAQSDAGISQGVSTGSLASTSDDSQLIGKADSAKESVGIYLWNSSTFAKGHIVGIAGESMTENSYGICLSDNDTFTIGGGKGAVTASGNTAAFYQPPVMDANIGAAKAWYGANETVAEASGEKSADDVAAYYTEQYVRIVFEAAPATDTDSQIPAIQTSFPATPPLTVDHSQTALWSVLATTSVVGIVLFCWLERKQER